MELGALLRQRKMISEGLPAAHLGDSPPKPAGRQSFSRSMSVPFLSSPEKGSIQAEGWSAWSNKLVRPNTHSFNMGAFGPISPLFGGDTDSPPQTGTLSMSTSPVPAEELDISEFVCNELEPQVEMPRTNPCTLLLSKPRRSKFSYDAAATSTECSPSGIKKFRDLSLNLATDEAKGGACWRQFEPSNRGKSHKENQNSLAERLKAEEAKSAELACLLEECRKDQSRLTEQVKESTALLTDRVREMQTDGVHLRAVNAELQAENKRLNEEGNTVKEELACLKSQAKEERFQQQPQISTESALRAVMTKPGSTVDEMRSAIHAVEALVGEARRELAAGQLRERRAAFETLYEAIAKADEGLLESAIAQARRAEVDAEDVEKAEAKLLQLRLLTEEERTAKGLEELKARLKPELFLLVKRGSASALDAQLGELDSDVPWQDWVDFNGRTLFAYAQELGATAVQEVLSSRCSALSAPIAEAVSDDDAICDAWFTKCPLSKTRLNNVKDLLHQEDTEATAASTAGTTTPGESTEGTSSPPTELATATSLPWMSEPSFASKLVATRSIADSKRATAAEDDEHAESRKAAFRAVVQDDVHALHAVLQEVSVDVWRLWENKAGRDLLTLSMERGSTSAYALLTKALGLVIERKRETFEERETVWVLTAGEVLAKRATVLEDASEEAEEVFLEYWDGDEPPVRLERGCVLKAY